MHKPRRRNFQFITSISTLLSQKKEQGTFYRIAGSIVYGGKVRKAKGVSPRLTYLKRNLLTEGLNLSIDANYNKIHNNNTDTLARQYNWKGDWRAKSSKGEGQYTLGEFDNKNGYIRANLTYTIKAKHFFVLNNLYSSFERKATDALANTENSIATTFMRRKNEKDVLGFSYKFVPTTKWNMLGFVKYYNTKVTGPVDISTGTSTSSYEERQKSSDVTGYGLAATSMINSGLQVKASFEKSYRLATETELFGDEVLETGNTKLKPENSRNINLNISYDNTFNQVHSLYLDAGFVYRDIKDYIRRQVEQRYGGAYYTNHGKVRNAGFDFEARYFYKKALAIGGNITYQNIRNRERYSPTGQKLIYYDDRMPNVPYLFGNVDASYTFKDLFSSKELLTLGYNMRYDHSEN